MKRITCLACLLLLSACAKKYTPYHSTANLPYFSNTIRTTMKYIERPKGVSEKQDYGVFACVDSLSVKYLIFAPNSPFQSNPDNPYEYYWMEHSVCLLQPKAEELLSMVKSTIASWNEDKSMYDATFYEFYLAPESEIVQVSEHVEEWNPTLRYWSQVNSSGSTSNLTIGEGISKKEIEMSDLDKVKELEYLLTNGLTELESMGY